MIIAKFKDEGQFEFDDGNGNATVAKGTIGGYYSAYAAKLGVETDSAGKQLSNNMSVLNHVEMRRASVSAVSLDEEMANLIMFSARTTPRLATSRPSTKCWTGSLTAWATWEGKRTRIFVRR